MRAILFISFLLLATCSWEGKLKFDNENSFTILQLTDMHFGETAIGGIYIYKTLRYEDFGYSISTVE